MTLRHKRIILPPLNCEEPPHRSGFMEDFLGDMATNLYARLQEYRLAEWEKLALAFEADPDDVYSAWYYVANHPMFYRFRAWNDAAVPLAHERHLDHESGWLSVHVDPHKVDPGTRRIEDDESRNTKLEWWVEFGPTLYSDDGGYGISGHDYTLDGGADDYESVITFLAKQIHRGYGNDRRQVVKKWKDSEEPQPRPVTRRRLS